MILIFIIFLVPPLVQCQRKGKYTQPYTHKKNKHTKKCQAIFHNSSICLPPLVSVVPFLRHCGRETVLQHKTSELQTDLAFTETKASWCMNLQISSGTTHSQLLNLLNASLMMFRSGDWRRCLKSICCLRNHSVFIWKILSLCNIEKQWGNSGCTTTSTWSNLSHVCWLLHGHGLQSPRLTVPNSKPIRF